MEAPTHGRLRINQPRSMNLCVDLLNIFQRFILEMCKLITLINAFLYMSAMLKAVFGVLNSEVGRDVKSAVKWMV